MTSSESLEPEEGVQRFKVIQTSPKILKIRLETYGNADRVDTWECLQTTVQEYLASLGPSQAEVSLAEEPPMRDPKSGKFRLVWSENASGPVIEQQKKIHFRKKYYDPKQSFHRRTGFLAG